MTSKGVNYYTHAAGPQFSVRIGAPKVDVTRGQAENFSRGGLQIESSNIPGLFNYTGTLSWQALLNGVAVGAGSEKINSLTGQTEGGTMSSMLGTPSSTGPGWALSYGFYDAGSGKDTPLTNQDQLYVYATENHSNLLAAVSPF